MRLASDRWKRESRRAKKGVHRIIRTSSAIVCPFPSTIFVLSPLVSFHFSLHLLRLLSPSSLLSSPPFVCPIVLRLAQSTTYHRSPFLLVLYSEAHGGFCERYLSRHTVRCNLWCFCEPCGSFAHVALPLPVTLMVISQTERYLQSG